MQFRINALLFKHNISDKTKTRFKNGYSPKPPKLYVYTLTDRLSFSQLIKLVL